MSVMKFGKYKNKELSTIPTDYLMYLVWKLDINDKRFGSVNKNLVDECHQIINSRTDSHIKPAKPKAKEVHKAAPPSIAVAVAAIRKQIDGIYAAADEIRARLVDFDIEENDDDFSEHRPV